MSRRETENKLGVLWKSTGETRGFEYSTVMMHWFNIWAFRAQPSPSQCL